MGIDALSTALSVKTLSHTHRYLIIQYLLRLACNEMHFIMPFGTLAAGPCSAAICISSEIRISKVTLGINYYSRLRKCCVEKELTTQDVGV